MRLRIVALVLLVALLSVACGPPWARTAGMGWRWPSEPTVGASSPMLASVTAGAVEAWGYGRLRPDCRGVDVCVLVGRAHHAGPRGDRPPCYAEIAYGIDTDGAPAFSLVVVEHEIGHCYGLGHSADPRSVMCSTGDKRLGVTWCERQGVTDADRAALRSAPGAVR